MPRSLRHEKRTRFRPVRERAGRGGARKGKKGTWFKAAVFFNPHIVAYSSRIAFVEMHSLLLQDTQLWKNMRSCKKCLCRNAIQAQRCQLSTNTYWLCICRKMVNEYYWFDPFSLCFSEALNQTEKDRRPSLDWGFSPWEGDITSLFSADHSWLYVCCFSMTQYIIKANDISLSA